MSKYILSELEKQIRLQDSENYAIQRHKDIINQNKVATYVNKKLNDISEDFIKVIFELIDLNKLLGLAEEYYYDPNTLSTTQQILVSYLTTNQIDREPVSLRFNKLFDEFEVMENFDYSYDFIKGKISNCSLFIKSSSILLGDLTNELFVALFCLNPLRYETTSFSYIYTGARTLPALVDSNEVMNISCGETNQFFNLLIESVDGIKLYDYIYDCSFEDFLKVYVILLNSLIIANERYSFTHYNLTSDNVIIKTLKQPIQVKTLKGIIITKALPVIFDYSKAYCVYEGIVFSTGENYDKGVNPLTHNYVSDSYQLLMSCLDICKKNNPVLYSQAIKIRKWFVNKVGDDIDFDEERKYSFRLPSVFSNMKNTKLLDWIVREYKMELHFEENPGIQTNYCNVDQQCFTRDRILDLVVDKNRKLDIPSLYPYYQKLLFIGDDRKANELLKTISTYNFALEYNKRIKEQNKRLKNYKLWKTDKLQVQKILSNKKTYLKLQSYLADISYEIWEFKTLRYYMVISEYLYDQLANCNKKVKVNKNSAVITEYIEELRNSYELLLNISDNAIDVINKIEDYEFSKPKGLIELLQGNSDLARFWNVFKLFKYGVVLRCLKGYK